MRRKFKERNQRQKNRNFTSRLYLAAHSETKEIYKITKLDILKNVMIYEEKRHIFQYNTLKLMFQI